MKKSVIVFILSASIAALPAKAQDYMFVGLYQVPGIKSFCGEVVMKQVAAFSKKEAAQIKKNFFSEHKSKQEGMEVLGPDSRAVVFEYQKEERAYNCTSIVRGIRTGKSIQEIQAALEKEYEKNPKKYKTKPSIIFVWNGKKL